MVGDRLAALQSTTMELQALVEAQQCRIDHLLQADIARREETAALRQCLVESGVLSEEKFLAQLHRHRFSAVRLAHHWSSDASLKHVLRTSDVMLAVASNAGPAVIQALRAASKDHAVATEAIFDAVKRQFPVKLYVCGGSDGSQQLSAVERFDPTTRTWEVLAPMSTWREGHVAAVIAGKLYVCGGYDGWQQLSSLERFDPMTGTWETLPPMGTRRAGPAAAVMHGQLCVCGGSDGIQCLKSVERFDPAVSAWEPLPPMSTSRAGPAAATIARMLYICGGSDDSQCLSSAERFDPATGLWGALPPMSWWRAGPAAVALDGQFYVCGGSDDVQCLSSAERYDPGTNMWEALPPMSTPREGPAAAIIAGHILICGGFDGEKHLSTAERFRLAERFDLGVGAWEALPAPPTGRVWSAAVGMAG